jgi:hypothetical protein
MILSKMKMTEEKSSQCRDAIAAKWSILVIQGLLWFRSTLNADSPNSAKCHPLLSGKDS